VVTALSRYGARWPGAFDAVLDRCRRAATVIRGPEIQEFEDAFAQHQGGGHAVTASYGRMAAYYIFQALDLPPGSEVVFPALTFWVIPEMARAAGLKPVFADVEPATFNLSPDALERALSSETRAVVLTHLYGLPCDMEAILAIARGRGLRVVEDCAHALGAAYRGIPVGTFGDAALFSFQVLKPLNTCGGGMAFTHDRVLAGRIAAAREAEPWPALQRIERRLQLARMERALMRPDVFSVTLFPILWSAGLFGARPDVYLWEKVRALQPFPPGYHERYSNVQAALGLAGLEELYEWTAATRRNAAFLTTALRGMDGITLPPAPTDRVHVYYQYCVHVPNREVAVAACLRRGLDVESHHMDVCPDLPLFGGERSAQDPSGARRTTETVQLPVHASLSADELRAVAHRARAALVAQALPRPPRPAMVAG
jgi:dTDP-4-amino-4,6-dideoxygalactose transaminase